MVNYVSGKGRFMFEANLVPEVIFDERPDFVKLYYKKLKEQNEILKQQNETAKDQLEEAKKENIEIFSKRIYKFSEKIELPKQELEVKYTSENTNGEKIICNYIRYIDTVVVCGGDGTINEVINGIIKCNKKINVTFIPFGTT